MNGNHCGNMLDPHAHHPHQKSSEHAIIRHVFMLRNLRCRNVTKKRNKQELSVMKCNIFTKY